MKDKGTDEEEMKDTGKNHDFKKFYTDNLVKKKTNTHFTTNVLERNIRTNFFL